MRASSKLDQEELIRESMVFGVPSRKAGPESSVADCFEWKVNEEHYKYSKKARQQLAVMGEYGRFKAKIDHSATHFTTEFRDQFCGEAPAQSFRKSLGPNKLGNGVKETVYLEEKTGREIPNRNPEEHKTVRFGDRVQQTVHPRVHTDAASQTGEVGVACRCGYAPDVNRSECISYDAGCQIPEEEIGCQRCRAQNQLEGSLTFGKDKDLESAKKIQKKNAKNEIQKQKKGKKDLKNADLQTKTGLTGVKSEQALRPCSAYPKAKENRLKNSRATQGEKGILPGLGGRIKELHGLTRMLPDSTIQTYTHKPAFQNYGRNNQPTPDPTRSNSRLKSHNVNPEKAKSRDKYFEMDDPKGSFKGSKATGNVREANLNLSTTVFDVNHAQEIPNRHRHAADIRPNSQDLHREIRTKRSVDAKKIAPKEKIPQQPAYRVDNYVRPSPEACRMHSQKELPGPAQRFVKVPNVVCQCGRVL